MDKLVMLVNIMLVAVYIISECDCDMILLDEAMCPLSTRTVVFASVDTMLHSNADGEGIYQMFLVKTFKAGPKPLTVSYDDKFIMHFPLNECLCCHNLPNDISKFYIIAGTVGRKGILFSNMCEYMRPVQEVYNEKDSHAVLWGDHTSKC